MKSSKQLREEIGELFDKAQAIVNVAKEDGRDLDDAEKKDFDAIMSSIGEEQGEHGPSGKWSEVKRAERYEAAEERLAQRRTDSITDGHDGDPLAFEIPRNAAYYGRRLKAFAGPKAQHEAFASGMFFLGLMGHEPSRRWCEDHGFRNALTTGDNSLGGFLVPGEMEATVIDLRETYGVFRANVMVTPMASDSKTQPRRKSGLTAYAVGDNQEITGSDKEWSQVELIAKKWGVLSKYSSEINEDAVISIADNLAEEMAYAFALKEDQAGFVGDGTSAYHGIQGITTKIAAGSVSTAVSGNVSFETLDLTDFEAAVGKLPQYAEIGAAWYISRVGYWASMARLMDAAGGNSIQDLGRGPERVFLGYPVRISQVLNSTLGSDVSAVKCLFGDLRLSSTMGNRRGLAVSISSDRYFELDQIGIKGTTRFAINNHEMGDASTAGPVIALKTAAS